MMTLRRVGLAGVIVTVAGLVGLASVRAADPKYFANDTEIVFTFNLKQILDSELVKAQKDTLDQVKALLEQFADNPAAKYLKEADFDVFRDLHSITAAGPGTKDVDKGTIIIEGKFNVDKFTAAAEKAAKDAGDLLKISKVGNSTVFEISPPGEKQMFASLVDDKTLIATAKKDDLSDALARAAGTKKSSLKKNFKVLLETTNKKQSVSFVATGPALIKMMEGANVPNAEVAAQFLQAVEGLSGAITIAKDVQFQFGVNANDADTATKMAQFGNVGLLTVRTMVAQKAKEDPKLVPVVDIVKTLRITNQGANILLRGEVSLDVIEKLMKNLPGQ